MSSFLRSLFLSLSLSLSQSLSLSSCLSRSFRLLLLPRVSQLTKQTTLSSYFVLAPSRLSSSSSSARRERFSRPVVADHRRCARSQSPTEPKGGFRTNFPRESNGPSLCSFPLSLLSVSLGRKFTHYLRSPSVGARGHSGTVARLRSLALPPPPTHAFSVPFRCTCLLSPALFLLRRHHYRPFAPPFSRSLSSSSSPSISFPLASLSAPRLFVLLREFTLSLLLDPPPSSLPRFVLLSSTDFRAASSSLSSLVASRASLLVRLEIPRFSVSVPLSATFHLPLLSRSLVLSFSLSLFLSRFFPLRYISVSLSLSVFRARARALLFHSRPFPEPSCYPLFPIHEFALVRHVASSSSLLAFRPQVGRNRCVSPSTRHPPKRFVRNLTRIRKHASMSLFRVRVFPTSLHIGLPCTWRSSFDIVYVVLNYDRCSVDSNDLSIGNEHTFSTIVVAE